MSATTPTELSPRTVLDVLARHILVDGYHVVMDMKRSRGSYLYDARSDRPILDFFSCFATIPIGYNHPKMKDPDFQEALFEAALTKPSTSDIYTEHFARFVDSRVKVESSRIPVLPVQVVVVDWSSPPGVTGPAG